jgi:uncharacterized protein YutD
MIETEHGRFEMIKDYKEAFEVKAFNDRYVDYLDKYLFIVGDISAEKLRLKGFLKEDVELIPDFLMESAVPNAPYYILKRLDDIVIKEETDES